MLKLEAKTQADQQPAIVVCAYEGDEDLTTAAGTALETGARLFHADGADPARLAAKLAECLRDETCRGLLLVGRNRKGAGFRVQMRAENRAPGGERLDRIGPGVARSTAPVADMVRALTDAGLAADASSDAEPDLGSYLLYRVLTQLPHDLDVPAVGLLRAPDSANHPDASAGVRIAAMAMLRRVEADCRV
jgi:hypothetical protein